MVARRLFAMLALGLAVSGCASIETATRNAPLDSAPVAPVPVSVEVQEINVTVPRDLKVSEANRYYPSGDIVWREDPPGDRHAQVKAIVEAALQRGVDAMGEGQVPAILDVEVTRFHALTEKARYTVGGVHALQFKMQLRDPETGLPYGPPHKVKADFRALGGQAAIEAEREGITQKSRITEHLAKVIRDELSRPDGHQAARLGVMGAINQL